MSGGAAKQWMHQVVEAGFVIDFNLTSDPQTGEEILEVSVTGSWLLKCPLFNHGTAFTEEERSALGLHGLVPPHVNTLDNQVARCHQAYLQKPTDLERHIYLRALQDRNETLFYRLLYEHIAEMMPIVYTPTVGQACQQFSHIYRCSRGLFLAYPNRDKIEAILSNRPYRDVAVVVVTDGERILGLGDQGADGMGIPIGKLSLYTLCAGIHPAQTLPVLLDVGTDNEERLRDPVYLGWRHKRVRGQDYDDFIETFVQAVSRQFPNVLLQWEDFARDNASRLLERYRDRLCTFNDDIQGTAAIVTATLLAAVRAAGARLSDQRVVMVGAGSAGCGISAQLCAAMVHEGLPQAEARGRFYLLGRRGLIREGLNNLTPEQERWVQPGERLACWPRGEGGGFGLAEVVKNVRPTVLIGTSGEPGLFTEAVVRDMAAQAPRPIILPLSNPTSRCEGKPADLLAWTEGRALVATGGPFPAVSYQGHSIPIAQCNNSYIFPGMGLGVLASGARRVTDEMFMAAAQALADCSPARIDLHAPLLPPLEDARRVSRRIALAVGTKAQQQDLAAPTTAAELECRVAARCWEPRYPRLRYREDRRIAGGGAPDREG
jgi:malate dehydrogenase (oxaloacetate-decarboxylating)